MEKLDIINELNHMREQNRTMANVLTAIIRQMEKEYRINSSPSDNNDFKKVCPECGWVIDESDENIEYDKSGMPICLKCGKPIPKS